MLRRHASLIVAILLVAFVATACIIRTNPNRGRRGQPVYVEKHKREHKKQAKKHRKDHRKNKRKH